MEQFKVSICLDKRRLTKTLKYPVRLQVYSIRDQKNKRYPTEFEYTEIEFDEIWNVLKPKPNYRMRSNELKELQLDAYKIAQTISYFTFEEFEKKYDNKVVSTKDKDIKHFFDVIIDKYKESNQIGTSNNYKCAKNSLLEYQKVKKGKEVKVFNFIEVNVKWLNEYENWMLHTKDNEKSVTTVSMYLRCLRAVFNLAIAEQAITNDAYPFKKGGYVMPATTATKTALNVDQFTKFKQSKCDSEAEQLALDFFLLSFYCNGINFKDIIQLKVKDMLEDRITFYRAKTINTSRGDLKPIVVYLNDFSKKVIEKYRKGIEDNDYLFDFISNTDSADVQFKAVKNFIINNNKAIKRICKKNGIEQHITSYTMRHSFATIALNKGVNPSLISESLGHASLKTTQVYLKGFEEDAKKDMMKTMNDL